MADDQYTPNTDQVRAAYVRAMRNAFIASAGEHEMEFDRWMNYVRQTAWAEGWQQGWEDNDSSTIQPENSYAPDTP